MSSELEDEAESVEDEEVREGTGDLLGDCEPDAGERDAPDPAVRALDFGAPRDAGKDF